MKDSPWRVVVMASSSWSHAFLTEKNHWIYPDLESDRAMLADLQAGDYTKWRDRPLSQMEASGQQEVLNWLCLVGAMAELDYKRRSCGLGRDLELQRAQVLGGVQVNHSRAARRRSSAWERLRLDCGSMRVLSPHHPAFLLPQGMPSILRPPPKWTMSCFGCSIKRRWSAIRSLHGMVV